MLTKTLFTIIALNLMILDVSADQGSLTLYQPSNSFLKLKQEEETTEGTEETTGDETIDTTDEDTTGSFDMFDDPYNPETAGYFGMGIENDIFGVIVIAVILFVVGLPLGYFAYWGLQPVV